MKFKKEAVLMFLEEEWVYDEELVEAESDDLLEMIRKVFKDAEEL